MWHEQCWFRLFFVLMMIIIGLFLTNPGEKSEKSKPFWFSGCTLVTDENIKSYDAILERNLRNPSRFGFLDVH